MTASTTSRLRREASCEHADILPCMCAPANRVPRAIIRFRLNPDLIACTPSAPTDDQRHIR
ncbi:hypothetical protein N7449_010741 [Penicillium cf. viridicatum]|uniref:Uncharacterized protein n=1 Tax=Penicillium cf. viridicatum TaxID=2972119 RepID=A0A9W9M599_9EURO|nr:hypothetical protein N7449_010741 [Penicillium cf. viridicatum]